MKINEVDPMEILQKAGVIPYFIDAFGTVVMMFMIPSDPEFGGTDPQIAKGAVDPGEDIQSAALREGQEELGLKLSNVSSIKRLPNTTITGLKELYELTVFIVKVNDPHDFDNPHYETGSVEWLTIEQFIRSGRTNQKALVCQAVNMIPRPAAT